MNNSEFELILDDLARECEEFETENYFSNFKKKLGLYFVGDISEEMSEQEKRTAELILVFLKKRIETRFQSVSTN